MNEPSLMQDAQVPRDARLIDIDALDNFIDRLLAASKDFYDAKPSWVTQDLKELNMHNNVYILSCIYYSQGKMLPFRSDRRQNGREVEGFDARFEGSGLTAGILAEWSATRMLELRNRTASSTSSPTDLG
jgi:hypothetical protein